MSHFNLSALAVRERSITLFLILPTMHIVIGAFQDRSGAFTLQNLRDLNTGTGPARPPPQIERIRPPSMRKSDPVMNPALSEAR